MYHLKMKTKSHIQIEETKEILLPETYTVRTHKEALQAQEKWWLMEIYILRKEWRTLEMVNIWTDLRNNFCLFKFKFLYKFYKTLEENYPIVRIIMFGDILCMCVY